MYTPSAENINILCVFLLLWRTLFRDVLFLAPFIRILSWSRPYQAGKRINIAKHVLWAPNDR